MVALSLAGACVVATAPAAAEPPTAAAGGTSSASASRAPANPGAAQPDQKAPVGISAGPDANGVEWHADRRSGIVIGMGGGIGVGYASGYPNTSEQIGDDRYYAASGLLSGSGGSFFLMGALADELSVGLFFGGGSYKSDTYEASGGGLGLRLDVFPLVRLQPRLRDWALFAEFGGGGGDLKLSQTGETVAEGAQSFLSAGSYYEFNTFDLFGGHFRGGPQLQYSVVTARGYDMHAVLLGGRFNFYGGP